MKDPLYKSFGYAFRGIWATIRSERNIKIHCAVAALVVVFGLWLGLSKMEWMICFILFGQGRQRTRPRGRFWFRRFLLQ